MLEPRFDHGRDQYVERACLRHGCISVQPWFFSHTLPPLGGGSEIPRNTIRTPKSLHLKQDVDLFSHFCRAQARFRLTDKETDTTHYKIIDRKSLRLTHSMRAKNEKI